MGNLKNELLVASRQGRLFLYDINSGHSKVIFETPNPNEYFMGIARYDDRIFLSSNYIIYELKPKSGIWECTKSVSFFPIEDRGYNPKIQHIRAIGDKLFVPTRATNSFFILNLDEYLTLLSDVTIKPAIGITDYDNIVDVFIHDSKMYCCFNSIAVSPENGGFVELDSSLKCLSREYCGWDCYNYSILDGDTYLLCNPIKDKPGGLVQNNRFRTVYNDDIYCMDYSISDEMIVLVGGALNLNNTNKSGGIIILLDRNFKQLTDPIMLCDSGQFMGCMFMENDLIKNLWSEDVSNFAFSKAYSNEVIRVRDFSGYDKNTIPQTKTTTN